MGAGRLAEWNLLDRHERAASERPGSAAPGGSLASMTASARRLRAWVGSAARRYRHAAPRAAQGYSGHRSAQLAAAISYHALFSLFPLVVFLVSIFGLVVRDAEVRADVVADLLDRFPLSERAGLDLERILSRIPTPLSAIGLVSLAALLWSASGMMAALRIGLTAAFDTGRGRPYFHSKLVDFLLVLGGGFVLLVSFGLTVLVRTVERYANVLGPLGGVPREAIGVAVPLLLTFAIVALLYHLVPPARPAFGQVVPGALVAAIGLELLKNGFALYLTTFGRYDVVYGSLGAVVAFLFLVYLGASVFLFGAELAADWPRAVEAAAGTAGGGAPSIPLRRRALGALRGLFLRNP
jgi:membrane protein